MNKLISPLMTREEAAVKLDELTAGGSRSVLYDIRKKSTNGAFKYVDFYVLTPAGVAHVSTHIAALLNANLYPLDAFHYCLRLHGVGSNTPSDVIQEAGVVAGRTLGRNAIGFFAVRF